MIYGRMTVNNKSGWIQKQSVIRYYPKIFLEGLRKTISCLNQDNWFLDRISTHW